MTASSDNVVRLVIRSCPSHLPIVRAATEKMCDLVGFDERTAGRVVLSVDEALTNVIRHAYGGADDRPIEIEMAPLPGPEPPGLRIVLRDYGPAVDPEDIRPRDLDDVRPGGLGVHIMRHCMDEVEYAEAPGGGTLLTMIKRVGDDDEGDAT